MSRINVMDQDEFQQRVQDVFSRIAETLERSFGPFGSNTFVSRYPDLYTTKDGFSIMKTIEFDDHIDTIIKDMIFGICARLNEAVGDGTTTATVATSKIYESYIEDYKASLGKMHVSSRDLLKMFQTVKDEIVHHLQSVATPIDFENDPENALKMIRSVVSIASNNDEELTDLITSAYQESNGTATIDVILPESGKTNIKKVEGYHAKVNLMDAIYFNNDNKTMQGENANVLILDHKLDQKFYRLVLKPLVEKCRALNRHLILIAPFYDNMVLDSTIRYELVAEFRAFKKPPVLVLTQCSFSTGYDRKRLNDLAMLLNTELMTSELASQIAKLMEQDFGNMDKIFSFSGEYFKDGDTFRLGVSNKFELAADGSVFSNIQCNKEIYDIYLQEAKGDYLNACERNRSLGTSTAEPFEALKRYNALLMNAYRLEIGGQSKIVQRYNKDVADDAVQAAKSALDNGVILGCNIDTMAFLDEREDELARTDDELKQIVYSMLANGFRNVIDVILGNADVDRMMDRSMFYSQGLTFSLPNMITVDAEVFAKKGIEVMDDMNPISGRFFCASDLIAKFCTHNHCVFDPVEKKFTRDIINSARTDIEILTAAIDLVSLLISGNQMVIFDQFIREQK